MKNHLIFLPVIFLALACQNSTTSQTENINVTAQPVDSSAKADSILKLKYSKSNFNATMKDLARWDSCLARQIDSSVNYVLNLPGDWKDKDKKIALLDTVTYAKIFFYTNQVVSEYQTYVTIEKLKKQDLIGPIKHDEPMLPKKPVIYIYPTSEQKTIVHLDFKGKNLYTWPKISNANSWEFTAHPDGILTDADGEQYPYLFWEGELFNANYIDLNEGFVVSADNTEQFFLEKLELLGLNTREYTDFITFWAPQMRKNKYNFIRFETTNYNKEVPLTVTPEPESMQRILMVYKPVDANYSVKLQTLIPFTRKGYTVIEWGGMELKEKVN